jgi:hypothetical protein
MSYKLTGAEKPPDLSSKGFSNNLSHAVHMDGFKCGPDDTRLKLFYERFAADGGPGY